MGTPPNLNPHNARRVFRQKIAFFVILLTVVAVSNVYTTMTNWARVGVDLPVWQPIIWETSSVICIALLIPVLGWWLTQFPVTPPDWRRNLPVHLLATLPFSLVHVAGMVTLRDGAYRLMGQHYEFGRWWPNWLYEYRKDFITYWVMVAGIMVFRLYGLWSEARAGPAVRPTENDPGERPSERLIVRKLNREYVLNVSEIDRIDANGNYVIVHAQGAAYPRRGSLAALEKKLDQKRFVRVHRGHLVNLDRIREIQPWDHGDYRIVLHDGSLVSLSRRYRDRLQHLLS